MNRSFTHYLILAIIVVLAAVLRLYQLDQIPAGLHGDEASIGYNAYSLLKTARDQDGNFLPLAFDQFGNFRAAAYHYFDVPFVATLGLNTLSVRLPASLFGIASIVVFYFLLNEIFESVYIGLLGAFLLAILPWHINLSRASSESIIASFFVILGTYFTYKAVKSKDLQFILLLLGFLSYLVGIFSYHTPAIFLPLFLPILLLVTHLRNKSTKIKITASVIFYCAVIGGIVLFLTVGKGIGRGDQVGLFSIPGGTTTLKHAADQEGVQNPLVTRFYDNKLIFYSRFFLTFYFEHLNGDFLFVNNGLPIRYKVPYTGNLFPITAPFIFLGFIMLVYEGFSKKKYYFLIPVVWLLLSPIPAALTWEDLPNIVRSSLMAPALVMLMAYGFFRTTIYLKGKMKLAVIAICLVFLLQNFLYFYHNYYWRSRIEEPWYRSASEPDLIFQVQQLLPKYSSVVMTLDKNNNFIFYLFYTKFDPKKFQELGSPKEHDGLVFGKVHYTYNSCPISGSPDTIATTSNNTLYVDTDGCKLPKNASVLSVLRNPDGTPTFDIVSLLSSK